MELKAAAPSFAVNLKLMIRGFETIIFRAINILNNFHILIDSFIYSIVFFFQNFFFSFLFSFFSFFFSTFFIVDRMLGPVHL